MADMQTKIIYMGLLDEGTSVWRPVQAEMLGDNRYRVLGPVPDDEVWEFPPGAIVGGQIKTLYDGHEALVAVTIPA
jgi:hypothetical protein